MSSMKDFSNEEALKAIDMLGDYQQKEIEYFEKIRYLRRNLKYFLRKRDFTEALVYTDIISDLYKSLIYDFNENCLYIISTYLNLATNVKDQELYDSFMKDYEDLKDWYIKYRLIYDKILGFSK